MKPICIIPARGGSKGMPRKNILLLAGRPLLAWSILSVQEALGADAVYVSTDDAEIASVARSHGANVILRPIDLAGDEASSELALTHALEEIRTRKGALPEQFLFLQCTSPLTSAQDIRSILKTMEQKQADSVLSVTSSHRFLWKVSDGGDAHGINHDFHERLRRQDRDTEFSENGAIYALKTDGFLKCQHRFFGKIALYEMPEERSWEIDSQTDFAIAEVMIRRQLTQRNMRLLPTKLEAVIFDFDGVMTNNKVITDEFGNEAIVCDRSDGLGIGQIQLLGLKVLVLSSEKNPVVASRCRKLNIECIHGESDKATRLKQWACEEGVNLEATIYLGNDVNDIGCLKLVGCPVVVADAYDSVKQHALIILEKSGGNGAVRELCDLIMDAAR